MGRIPRLVRLFLALVAVISATAGLEAPARAQIDPALQSRVEPAVIQIAQWATVVLEGVPDDRLQRVGSGTVVAPDGLILTNHHVIDPTPFSRVLEAERQDLARQGLTLEYRIVEDLYVILIEEPFSAPIARYTARVVGDDPALDLAALRIVGGPRGQPLSAPLVPYVELGDSNQIRPGDQLHLYGYPGNVPGLYYTSAVVGRLEAEKGVVGTAWFLAPGETISPGSSGGAAVDVTGRLVAVPTSVSAPECLPGADADGNGVIDAADSCVPVGSAVARLRPINLALPLLRQADPEFFGEAPGTAMSTTPGPPRKPPIEPAASPPPGVPATETYVSPGFGYTLSYDPSVWRVVEGPTTDADGIENIGLRAGLSTLYLTGVPGVFDAQQCVQIMTDAQTSMEDAEAFEPLPDDAGTPTAGGDAEDAFVTTRITRTLEGGMSADQAFYARCIVLPSVSGVLVIQQFAAEMIYDSAAAQREQLLEGLTLS